MQYWRTIASLFVIACLCIVVTTPVQAGMISEKDEIAYGKSMHRQVLEQSGGLYDNPKQKALVDAIAQRLIPVCDRPNLPWIFTLVNDDSVNAFATLGGRMYVTKGLLNFVQSQDELALVMAHEMGHITQRHVINSMERDTWTTLLLALLVKDPLAASNLYQAVSMAQSRGYGFKAEHEADAKGIEYVTKAGFNPYGGVVMMERFKDQFGSGEATDLANWLQPHPKFDVRIADFENYIHTLGWKAVPKVENDHCASVYIGDKMALTFAVNQGELTPHYRAQLAAGVLNQYLAVQGTASQLWLRRKDGDPASVELMARDQILATVTENDAEPLAMSTDELAEQWLEKLATCF